MKKPHASEIIKEYELWLLKNYDKAGTYLNNAKAFCRTLDGEKEIAPALTNYCHGKSASLHSILKRFERFLSEKSVEYLNNDLAPGKTSGNNTYVNLFIKDYKGSIKGDSSARVYLTVLNRYFSLIRHDVNAVTPSTAEKYILSPKISDFTQRLYKTVLKAFCLWTLELQCQPDNKLPKDKRKAKRALLSIEPLALITIAAIKVPARSQLNYYKASLSHDEREKMLATCNKPLERALLSLMAYNAVRKDEILELSTKYCDLKNHTIEIIRGKERKKIRLLPRTSRELKNYLKIEKVTSGKLFPKITGRDVEFIIHDQFKKIRLSNNGRFTPYSLRHTSAQLMYDDGASLGFIQKTLRLATVASTMVYTRPMTNTMYLKTSLQSN